MHDRVDVFGDSHACIFWWMLPRSWVHWAGPITMYRVGRDGVDGVHATTGVDYTTHRSDWAIWHHGEIDVRGHLAKRRETIPAVAERYARTAISFSRALGAQPIIVSVTPAMDGSGHIVRSGSLEDRRSITVELNSCLRAQCTETGVRYLDLFSMVVGEDGGIRRKLTSDLIHLNVRGVRYVRAGLRDLGLVLP